MPSKSYRNNNDIEWRILSQNPNYAVSNYGEVKSLIARTNTWVGRILKGEIDKDGYHRVRLGRNGGKHLVHRLVFEEFCGHIENGKEINHINGDKNDNRPINLELVTNFQNHQHAKVIGLKAKGEQIGVSKLKTTDIFEIFEKHRSGMSYASISTDYGVSSQAIGYIVRGKNWRWLNAQ
jgi:hypothetical protein